ncbi:MAG: alkaline phosphatase D family protein [Myxococcota bacterium]
MSDDPRDGARFRLNRRQFIGLLGATISTAACGEFEQQPVPDTPNIERSPFTLGVASGDPLATSIILWTRLAPEQHDGGGMPDEDVPVIWEISRDQHFRSIEQSGVTKASPLLAHSVHKDVRELEPNTTYYYRFRLAQQSNAPAGEWISPTGRTKTLPLPHERVERFRIAAATCQNFQDGYYTAYSHMADEDLDLVAFLGDYIYEYGPSNDPEKARRHNSSVLRSLADFRGRYAQYKSDENLQECHRIFPWYFTWDDHEVTNNYAGLMDAGKSLEFMKELRTAAYQAYYEHMPLRLEFPEDPINLQLYRSAVIGDLVKLYVLDGRQYRTAQPCDGDVGAPCDEVFSEDQTMLGREQLEWLQDEMLDSRAIWNAVAQQTVFSPMNLNNSFVNPDQWDGYQYERQELLDFVQDNQIRNWVIMTGDIHTAGFGVLNADDDDPDSEVIGYEFVTTSISSGGDGAPAGLGAVGERATDLLENVKYINAQNRGYCVLDFERDRVTATYKVVSTVLEREADVRVDRQFVVTGDELSWERTDEQEAEEQ